jgi:hypothetical protein
MDKIEESGGRRKGWWEEICFALDIYVHDCGIFRLQLEEYNNDVS